MQLLYLFFSVVLLAAVNGQGIRLKGFDECGSRTAKLNTSTTEGVAAKGSAPWLAALGQKDSKGKFTSYCIGSLITDMHILTAASCFTNENVKTVRLGEYDLTDESESVHEDFSIAKITTYENYTNEPISNDIAILTLSKPVQFKDHIFPICLPGGQYFIGNPLDGKIAFGHGWGQVVKNKKPSPVMKEIKIPVWKNEDCRVNYADFVAITSQMLCAGAEGKDLCSGDSGAPLVVWDPQMDRYSVIGILSFGVGCGEAQYPGVYMRTTEYLNWIAKQLL